MEQKDKKTERIEQAEKVAGAIDKGVNKASEILDSGKQKSGDLGPKIQVGLVLVAILAMVKDPGMIWIALGIGAILFSGKLIAVYKKMTASEKKEEKQEEKK